MGRRQRVKGERVKNLIWKDFFCEIFVPKITKDFVKRFCSFVKKTANFMSPGLSCLIIVYYFYTTTQVILREEQRTE